jgi:hypothetical protein
MMVMPKRVKKPAASKIESDALTGWNPITDLARMIEVPPMRLHPRVDYDYLRVLVPHADFKWTIVARP